MDCRIVDRVDAGGRNPDWTVISGKTSAMKNFRLRAKGTPLVVPDSIPSSNSFAGIVNRVEPAVVNISTRKLWRKARREEARAPQQDDQQQDDPMQDFFDRFFDGRGDAPPAAERQARFGCDRR